MKIGGHFTVSIGGEKLLATDGECTYNAGVPKYVAEKGSDGRVAGFSSETEVPFIELEIYLPAGFDSKKLMEAKNAEIIADFANDTSFILRGAYRVSEGDHNSKGRLKIKFEGMEAELV